MGVRENECQFHKNCENSVKILKISCVRYNFVKFDIHFLRVPSEFFFGITILVQGFRPPKIRITQFPSGFRVKVEGNTTP